MNCEMCGNKTKVDQSISTTVGGKPTVIRRRSCKGCPHSFQTTEQPSAAEQVFRPEDPENPEPTRGIGPFQRR
jgi:transcriptional regulator NrdR family protein